MMSRAALSIAAVTVGCAVIAGCGGTSSTGTADTAGTRAAGAACPVVPGAVSQGVIFTNRLDIPVTLRAEKVCGSGSTPVFSGDAGPAQLDGLRLEAGSSVDVRFEGVPGRRLPFDLNPDVEGGMADDLPWSVRLGFGATDGQGGISGWDEGYERYTNGPALETFATKDGLRFSVGVVDGTVTFAPVT